MLRSLWLRKVSRALFGRSPSRNDRRSLYTRTRLNLEPLEDRTLLSGGITTTTGLISAISSANAAGGSTTITLAAGTTFDFTTANNTTNGGNALPVITANITIVGNGDTIERTGSNAFRFFDVASGGSLNLQSVTLSGGSVSGSGGGIFNYGTLTVSDSTLSGNSASKQGGGIYNSNLHANTLMISDCTLSSNSAGSNGGGIANQGTMTVSDSTLSGNSATSLGGGIANFGILTVSDSTLSGNSAQDGGGVTNSNQLTLSDSTLSGNSATNGGGIYSSSGPVTTLSNCTLTGNSASQSGGGVWLSGNNATFTNVTLYGNSAAPVGPSGGGGGAYIGATDVVAHNTLIAGNQNGDIDGSFDSASSYDLIGDGSGGLSVAKHNLLGSTASAIDPKVAALGSYGGPTQTLALLPGSPAIGAGSSSFGGSTDQRGLGRSSSVDIGAFQTQTSPLVVNTNDDTATGAEPAGELSLRDAINLANVLAPVGGANTITFAAALSGDTITLAGIELPAITANITITGLGASNLTVSGNNQSRVFDVDSGATVSISGLTISGGFTSGAGGGIYNTGTLTLSDSTLSGNSATAIGGGIYNTGSLTVSDTTLSGNSAGTEGGGINNFGNLTVSDSTLSGNSAGHFGGAINTVGSLTVSDSTLSGNSANDGGGISNGAVLTVSDSTLSGNSAGSKGGGIYNIGTLTVSDSTLSGNSAGSKGGGVFNSIGNATVSNGTVYDNSAASGGGIYVSSGGVTLHNTLVAGSSGGDVQGTLASSSNYNLIGDGSGGLTFGTTTNRNITGNPLLAPLGIYGGPIQTLALLPGSPAIDAGSSAYGGTTDQRGDPRVGNTDIGAFESQGFTIAVTSGNNQSTTINSAFTHPLLVTVTAKNAAEPVAGGQVTFTAPSSGASAAFTPTKPVSITPGGTASVTATANGTIGNYNVTANAAGAAGSVTFSLTNQQGTPKLSVSDAGGTYTGNSFAASGAAVDANTNQSVSGSFSFDYFDITTSTDLGSTAPSNVGNYKVTATFSSTGPNYASGGQVSTTFKISQASINYTIGSDSQTYGGPAADLAADLPATFATGVNGETLGISYASSGDTALANAGSYAITGTLSNGTGLLSNYIVTLTNGTLTVNPYAFSYTIGSDSQTYGHPANLADDLGGTITSGPLFGQTLTISYASTGDTATANVGTYAITGTVTDGTGLASNYKITLNNGTLTVNPYAFTYTIGNDSQTYGHPAILAADLPNTIATGVNGENLGISYSSTGDTTTANVGSYAITGTLSNGTGEASNYSVTLNSGTLTVNPYAFTYTIGNDSQTYGHPADLAADLGNTIATGVNGETLGIAYFSTGDTATVNVGTYALTWAVLSSGSGSLGNYSVTFKDGTLTVNPFAFSYTIGNDSQTYGHPANLASDLPGTISTGVNGETLGIAYSSTGDTATANVGSYAITATLSNGTGLASNYSVTLNSGTLTVNPFSFTYTIGNDSQTYGHPANLAGDLPSTISTGVNGETLDISYASTGDTATANVNTYAITGTLSNGSGLLPNYIVTLNSGTLTVHPFAFSYAIGNDSQTYGSPANLAVDLPKTVSTGVNGETLDIAYSSTGDTATAIAGTYAITGSLSNGSGLLSDYTVTLTNGILTVNAASTTTTITSTNVSIPFSNTTPQSISLNAVVTSTNGETVNEGSVTFTVGALMATGNVSGGSATATLILPAGFASGSYPIHASYADTTNVNGVVNYKSSTVATAGTLTVQPPPPSPPAIPPLPTAITEGIASLQLGLAKLAELPLILSSIGSFTEAAHVLPAVVSLVSDELALVNHLVIALEASQLGLDPTLISFLVAEIESLIADIEANPLVNGGINS